MTAAARRVMRVWLPALAVCAVLYIVAGAMTLTINGLGLVALLGMGATTLLAARDAERAHAQDGRH